MIDRPGLSVVIPCYNSATTIGPLVAELAALRAEGGHEIVLVNDGSGDDTARVCRELVRAVPVPVTFVDLARNFGEHNAVMAGLRVARGSYVITADDDGQNPPSEVEKLYRHARASGKDVVYTYYAAKRHAPWRNLGSWLANRVADLLLDKPRGLYLSSFRCMNAFVVEQIRQYDGPYPYVDGLVFQVTRNVGCMEVTHQQRRVGRSTYSLRKLVHLWLNLLLNFSVVPLRVSSVLGLVFSVVGFLATLEVVVEALLTNTPPGWGSFMCALLVFSGVQLLTIGLVGEYVGRMYLTINRRPQSVVRDVVRGDGTQE
jgi:glycosyltransferase involved in cell wall biosynthesis